MAVPDRRQKTEDVQSVGGIGLAERSRSNTDGERLYLWTRGALEAMSMKSTLWAVPACEFVCDEIPMPSYLIYALPLALPLLYILLRRPHSRPPPPPAVTAQTDNKNSLKTIMQAPRDDLHSAKDDPFTLSALAEFDGSDDTKPIYVSIKGNAFRTYSCTLLTVGYSPRCTGDVFDVTRKCDVYGKGGSYNIFAGKDGSKGLGMSSLNPEDAVPDYSTLPDNEKKVLDDWHSFFSYVSLVVARFRISHARQETIQYRGACHGLARGSRTQV